MSLTFRKPSTDGIPKHLTTLGVGWFNNQFKAVAVYRGRVLKAFEPPGAFEGQEKFDEFIRDAVRETGYQGNTVSLVLTHPRLVQQIIDVPPVKEAALNKVIQRQAQQQKYFQGEAAYASQMLVSSKGSPRRLLHLFPRLIVSQLMLACRRNDLHLVSVLPASAALQKQLPAIGLQKGDVVMLAAETAGSTTAIVCDGDGRLLMARTLQGSWNDDVAKLALDLNRTVLFVGQQFNVTINRGLYLFGQGAAEQAAAIQRTVQLPVKLSPVAYEPLYWVTESLKVRPESAPNFLSPELMKAPQRRVFAKVVAAAAMVLLAGSIALTAYSLLQSRRERATMASFSEQIKKMESRQDQLEQLNAEMERKEQAIRLVLGGRPAPVPAWFLAYLGQVVPPDLVITNLNIKREMNYYRVKVGGTRQQGVVTPTAMPLRDSVEALKATLAGSPFHMRILETNTAGPVQPAKPEPQAGPMAAHMPDWLKGVATAVATKANLAPARVEVSQNFAIEGVLR